MALMSLIMLALMSVFNSTQAAFRASITQTDVLEGGRATMELVASDLRRMYPSGGYNVDDPRLFPPYNVNTIPFYLYELPSMVNLTQVPVNFWLSPAVPTVIQPLVGATAGQSRTNELESFFILEYQNQVWHGVGYFVDTNSANYIYPLYRYDSFSVWPSNRPTAYQIFTNYLSLFNPSYQFISDTNPSIHHLLDGVVHLDVRAYDGSGILLTNGYGPFQPILATNDITYYGPGPSQPGGEVGMLMCSNSLPAAVELQMGVLEDRTLSRASSFGLSPPGYSNYLAQQVGKVHLFRQRVTIANFDPTAYQQ